MKYIIVITIIVIIILIIVYFSIKNTNEPYSSITSEQPEIIDNSNIQDNFEMVYKEPETSVETETMGTGPGLYGGVGKYYTLN